MVGRKEWHQVSLPLRLVCALLAGLLALPAVAADFGPYPDSDGWISLGAGFYDGQDYKEDAIGGNDADEVQGAELMVALNTGTAPMLRLRLSQLFGFTSNAATEVAALLALPLSPARDRYLAFGIGRLVEVSNKEQSPTAGLSLEFIAYANRGLEFSLHGNLNPDSDFFGVTIAGVFGKASRPRLSEK